jgi:hypothetical protein
MATVITHFYNEEYLLPYWLKHHRQYFEHGILINYHSTDKSVEICKELCPTWDIVDSVNPDFDAALCDKEVMDYESKISGFKLALNTTEFMIGNFDVLNQYKQRTQLVVPCYLMVDNLPFEDNELDPDVSLLKQRTFGIDCSVDKPDGHRPPRSFHNFNVPYKPGRHFYNQNTDDFRILWYGFSPWNERQLQRKLQIKDTISHNDIHVTKWGLGHYNMTRENLQKLYEKWVSLGYDLSEKINSYLDK